VDRISSAGAEVKLNSLLAFQVKGQVSEQAKTLVVVKPNKNIYPLNESGRPPSLFDCQVDNCI
jgi:hypothetical protein